MFIGRGAGVPQGLLYSSASVLITSYTILFAKQRFLWKSLFSSTGTELGKISYIATIFIVLGHNSLEILY